MYHVDLSGEIHQKITALFRQACRENRGKVFLDAFKKIIRELEQDPLEFGEPLYHLYILKLQVRTAAVLPLSVEYGVSQDHNHVVIRHFHLMNAH